MPAHVFISYSRKDTAFVEKLERALNQRGILTWRDLHSIVGGDEWFRAIKAGLCNSYAMVYVDTPNAEGSAWVMQEYLYARRLSLPILPVTIDATHFSLQTISLQPILCTDERFEIAVAQLAAALAALPQSAVTAPPLVAAVSPLRPQDERDYLEWVLVNAKADLLDARYAHLIGTPSPPAAQNRDEGSFWDEDVFRFERLGLEQVRGEAFDSTSRAKTWQMPAMPGASLSVPCCSATLARAKRRRCWKSWSIWRQRRCKSMAKGCPSSCHCESLTAASRSRSSFALACTLCRAAMSSFCEKGA
jgi:hypothetical protein